MAKTSSEQVGQNTLSERLKGRIAPFEWEEVTRLEAENAMLREENRQLRSFADWHNATLKESE